MSHLFIFKQPKKMQCSYIKADGSSCWASAMANSEYCWFHAPEVDYERGAARARGGKAFKPGLRRQLPTIKVEKMEDVSQLLIDTVKQLRHGFISARIAATLGYLSGMILKSFEAVEVSSRLKKAEQEIKELKEKAKKKSCCNRKKDKQS